MTMKTTEKKPVPVANNLAELSGNLRKTDPKVTINPKTKVMTRHGDLVLEKDRTFEHSIVVEGNIVGKYGMRYNLVVNGSINAKNINAGNIDAWGNINARGNINAWNIDARGNIRAGNIDAWNIDAWGNINTRGNINTQCNINAKNINTCDINAWGNINTRSNIDARGNINAKEDIHAGFILCEKLIQPEGKRLVCRKLIEERSTYELKEIKR